MILRGAVFFLLAACTTDKGGDDTDPISDDADGDGYAAADDCDDTNASISPDAAEVCDGVDNNCDGATDEGVTITFYVDGDSDGYGDSSDTREGCTQPSGYVDREGDCSDTDAAVYPGAAERCDTIDNDCDGDVDEPDATDAIVQFADSDGDGYGDSGDSQTSCANISGYVQDSTDCDDTRTDVYPGAPLACDGTDANCDGKVDNDDDLDGYTDAECGGLDCDDTDSTVVDTCTPGLTPDYPGIDCNDIITQDSSVTDGVYWIDPDEGDHKDAFEVYCDMTTDGGGWTVTYLVDAEHFDAVYANNVTLSTAPPLARNEQSDIWNAELEMSFSELLYACTTQGDKSTYYWTYTDTAPHTWYTDTVGSYDYQTISSTGTNAVTSTCMSTHNSSNYGFVVLEQSSCGSCSQMLYGMYHYPSIANCNYTSATYGNHASPYDSRSIDYPICNKQQTSNGSFWMAVR